MCTSRASRRKACFSAFVFLCLLKYTLPIIADFKNLQILIPGEEEEGALVGRTGGGSGMKWKR